MRKLILILVISVLCSLVSTNVFAGIFHFEGYVTEVVYDPYPPYDMDPTFTISSSPIGGTLIGKVQLVDHELYQAEFDILMKALGTGYEIDVEGFGYVVSGDEIIVTVGYISLDGRLPISNPTGVKSAK